jgi:hypothetical protein
MKPRPHETRRATYFERSECPCKITFCYPCKRRHSLWMPTSWQREVDQIVVCAHYIYKRVLESITHLPFPLRTLLSLWGLIKDWLGLHALDFQQWPEHSMRVGGSKCRMPPLKTAKSCCRLLCSPLGRLGARGMWVSSNTNTSLLQLSYLR